MTTEPSMLEVARALMSRAMQQMPNHFVLSWEGSKIPRGASLGGVEIGWTQHGMITGANSTDLGYYERLEEFGGPSGNRQTMVVSSRHADLVPPTKGTVTALKL